MTRRLALAACLGLLATLLVPGAAHAAPVVVTNATQFTDTTGSVVHAHGGGVLKVGSFYYWFGENRNPDNSFRAVSVYRSTDLRTWEFRNNVLTQSSHAELASANIERPKVVFNSTTGQYVMWMHKETATDYAQARAAVATSSTVDGAYTYRGSFRPLGHMSRDITLFRDDDGTGYMISAARDNADLHVYRLSADYLTVASLVHILWPSSWREAPAMFKRNGVYFLLTSGATGWSPNQQRYATATSIAGTWSALADVGDGTAFGSQTAFVLPVAGTQTTSYLYFGDRWAGAWGGRVNDSLYVWLPVQFPSARTMSLSWSPQVSIDTATGVVSGVGGTPYMRLVARHSGKCADVRDGSTADRTPVIQWSCNGGTNQQWRFQDIGGGYAQIVARHSNKCIDVSSGSTADGARLLQWPCGSGTNQQWQVQDAGGGFVRLVARHSGKCLEVISRSTSDGAELVQWACNGGTNQQWSRPAA